MVVDANGTHELPLGASTDLTDRIITTTITTNNNNNDNKNKNKNNHDNNYDDSTNVGTTAIISDAQILGTGFGTEIRNSKSESIESSESIKSNTNYRTATNPSSAVSTGMGGLVLRTMDPTPSLVHVPSTVSALHQSATPARTPAVFDRQRDKERALPIVSYHRYDDDNASQYSASSLATSFSKSFLFGFLNNTQKDRLRSGGLISKEYWMKDETSAECFSCGRLFTTFRRKHHCRICGQIFCSKCTVLIPGDKFNHPGKMRVCKTCLSFATEYNDSSDESSFFEESVLDHEHTEDQASLNANTPKDEGHHFLTAPTPPPRMAIPATRNGESVEIPVSRSYNSRISSIHTTNFSRRKPHDRQSIYHKQQQQQQDHITQNHNTHKSNNEVSFADYIDNHNFTSSFNFNNNINNHNNSGSNSNGLQITPNEEHLVDDMHSLFDQNSDSEDEGSMSLYAALHLDKSDLQDHSRGEIKSRLPRSNTRSLDRAQASLFRMRNRRKSKSVSRPPNSVSHSSLRDVDKTLYQNFNNSSPNISTTATAATLKDQLADSNSSELNDVCQLHFQNLLLQELENESVLDIKNWIHVLTPILYKIGDLEYNIKAGDSMDIRQYVKLKRLCGGKASDTCCINGLVFSKTLALKGMPRHLMNPKIALIMFPLEYMKSEQHFMSLEPVMAQEKEYLIKLVGRIIALNPDVVFVGASISGLALKLLNESGIAVSYNLKPQVIERIARLTQGDIVISMDKLALNLKLGTCSTLDVRTFAYQNLTKTFIFLTGCNPKLGCTLLIRGGDNELLRKVKETAEFMVYAICNLKLETSFYKDNFMYLSQDFYNKMISGGQETCDGYDSEFLNEFNKKILSVSPTVKFDPPYLLTKAREIEQALNACKLEESKVSKIDDITKELLRSMNLNSLRIPNHDLFKIVKCVLNKKIDFLEESFNIRARQWELFGSFSPDLFQVSKHQNIVFLYSMVSAKNSTSCIGPNVLQIDYYWENDMTLGQYIEHLLYSANNICSEGCGKPLSDHYRSYVHGSGKIDVMIEKFQSRIPTLQNVILTWSYCKQCGYTSPFLPMSETTWKYSFGKYLEMLFWSKKNSSTNLAVCPHDFTKDHIKYFTLNDLTVRMEFSKVDLLEVLVPRQKITWKPDINIKLKIELRGHIVDRSNKFFSSVSERLNRVKVDSMSNDKMEAGQKRIEELKIKVEREQHSIFQSIDDIYNHTPVVDHLLLNSILRTIQDLSVEWDQEFVEFEAKYLPSEKDIARITALQLKRFFLDSESKDDFESKSKEDVLKEREKNKLTESTDLRVESEAKFCNELEAPGKSSTFVQNLKSNKVLEEVNRFEKLVSNQEQKNKRIVSNDCIFHKAKTSNPVMLSSMHNGLTPVKNTIKGWPSNGLSVSLSPSSNSPRFDKNDFSSFTPTPSEEHPKLGISTNDLEFQLQEGRRKSMSTNSTSKSESNREDGKVMKLTNYFDQIHFETLSKEFEMQREKERLKLLQNRYKAAPVGSSKPIVEIYKNVEDAVEENKRENSAANDERSAAEDNAGEEKAVSDPDANSESELKEEDFKAEIPQTERISLMKTLTNFWADRSATLWKPLEYPLSSLEHIFFDSDVIVREDEPSSLIAFCLSSSDYTQKICVIRDVKSDGDSKDDSGNVNDNNKTEDKDLEKIMLKKTGVHLKYQFQEGGTLLSCKIFFAEQFDAFRRKCGLDENFIQSLSRCIKWDSSGGKSGSAFLKTLDDRLVIKELSNAELDSFVKFAPSYFEYMTQALFHDLPTVIAKVFGFYQIQIKNPINGKNVKMDVLIMENLFYDKKGMRIFDLKGSMRNRHVEQTGKENEVLLDENMVEYIYESPLFVREYDKKLLRASLWNDTLFLAKMNVMDYSLVIGINEEQKEITVGIIDCIRTFTWDKKLESWVKERGLVGGGTKEPTVVTPRQYKNRFREAMDRYILMVPDCWYHGS